MKDLKISLCFKNDVVRELYDAEEDEVKDRVPWGMPDLLIASY
jgi:hypothetical protein